MSNINIPDVTLIAVSSIKIEETILALQKSYEEIDFGAIKLVTHEFPDDLPEEISFEKCPELNNIMKYNQFIFKELYRYVDTSHCLVIQYDSWVLNPELWDNNWLQWDYCGAPWEWRTNSYLTDNGERVRVGNGGFSLRSKKLLNAPEELGLKLEQRQGYWNEDGNLTVYHRDKLLSYGIKYAPVEVAAKFSYETSIPENNFGKMKFFGFHKNAPPKDLY